jgi:arylamine N-acetyltransferase
MRGPHDGARHAGQKKSLRDVWETVAQGASPKDYLERIGYHGSLRPGVGLLRELHKRHLLSVPFENLDIAAGRPIVLSQAAFYDKIIGRRRGGFC